MRTLILILIIFGCTLFTFKGYKVIEKITYVKPIINKDSLLKKGMPKRITEQYVLIMENQKNKQKSFFIVDTRENLIFFFDKNGNFIAKSPTIDGFDKQSKNPKVIKETLKSWSVRCKEIGFKWDCKKRTYIDTTNKNRIYTDGIVFNYLAIKNYRYFPKGIYNIPNKYFSPNYIGDKDNVYSTETIDGIELSKAIHGVYQSTYRLKNIKILEKNIGSNFNNMYVSENYRKLVLTNHNNSMFNNSYGCINVPSEFLKLTNDKAVGSLLFVIGEDEYDYLIK